MQSDDELGAAVFPERPQRHTYDAIVIGSGPNGLAAAITLVRAGCSVLVYEARESVGGGARSDALTMPGFIHDVCSSIHPLAVISPFFQALPLHQYGLEWIYSPAALAHPFDDGTAVLLDPSIELTAHMLGEDAGAYQRLMGPLVASWNQIKDSLLGPLQVPHHPLALLRFALRAMRSARGLAECTFSGERARGFFAGVAAHAMMPLERLPSAAFGLVLGILGHVVGWPLPRGGAQRISNALAAYLQMLGGEITTGVHIASLDDLPTTRTVLCDVTPRQLLQIAGHRLPARYRRQLQRYRYGPAAFKVDWALDAPIPWKATECIRAATVHVGGTLAEIATAERAAWEGRYCGQPFVLVAQQSLFDPSRAPTGKHVAWAYCHVPNGSIVDMTEAIEAQIERFAPGFRQRILARHVFRPGELEQYNPNYIGGDINGGVQDLWQLFTRPVKRLVPYATPAKGLYICSSSTPPGGGVHGMCGYHAAHAALRATE